MVRHLAPLAQRLRLLCSVGVVGLVAGSGGSTQLYLHHVAESLLVLDCCEETLALREAEEQQTQSVRVVDRHSARTHVAAHVLRHMINTIIRRQGLSIG